MIHILVHDKKDTVGVAVVEGIKSGQELIGWVMEDDSTIKVKAANDIPIGHKVATSGIKTGDLDGFNPPKQRFTGLTQQCRRCAAQ